MNLKSCEGPPLTEKKGSALHQILRTVRLVVIILISFCLQVHANVFGQQVTLNVKNASVQSVLDEIKKQSGYGLISKDHIFDNTTKITLTLKNVSIQKALTECLKDQPLTYEMVGKTIVIKEKPPQQKPKEKPEDDITVRGIVADTAGTPLAGATIIVEGTRMSTISNTDGSFEIKDIPANSILTFRLIGYAPVSIPVSDNPESYLKVTLKASVTSLSQVSIISTGYQQLPKERVTGSFTQIDNRLLNRSVSTDIISRLKGVTSGLNFDNSSGNSLGISIRGRSTLVSNTQPLIVLNNFPYEGDINSINPNDVESITVLKDAAASSIWGALAGNGVIVITTKKGKYNQPLKIDFNSNLTLQKKPDLFYRGNRFLNSGDYIGVEKMLFDNGFYDNQLSDQLNYPAVSPAVETLNNLREGTITAAQANQQLSTLGEHDLRNDLNKYFYRTSTLQQYSLNLHGGSENINYTFSAGEDNDVRNEIGNKYNRITLNSNVNFRPVKMLEIYTNLNYSNSNTTSNSNVSTLMSPGFLYPYAKLADDNGNPLPVNKYFRHSFIDAAPGIGLLDWAYRPLEELRSADNTSNLSDIRINSGLKYNLVEGLNGEVRYQYEKAITSGRSYADESTYEVRNLINQFSVINGDGTVTRNIPMGGILDNSNNVVISNYVRGQLNYNNRWKKNEINALAGGEIRQIAANGDRVRLYGYDSATGTTIPVNYVDYFPNYPGGSSTIFNNSDLTQTTDRYRSVFANASYIYDDKYILSVSGRLDQSNLFGVNTNQKGVPLWSTGFKWKIDKEDFYKVAWLPRLAFRVTYGYSGNVNKTVTAFTIAEYKSSSLVPAVNYAKVTYPGNPDLRWEKIGMLNLGVDFALRKVLSGTIEYYLKYGSDLIGNAPIAASTGFASATGNFANISGKGFDITLNSHNISSANFNWTTTLLSSYAIDKVTKYLGGSIYSYSFGNIAVGVPYNSGFANKFEGLNDKGDPQGILNGQLSTDYNALNNLPNSEKVWYRAQPAYFGSIRNDFSYKQLTLSINLLYKTGYSFLRNGINYNNLFNNGIGNADFTKRWQTPGDELHTSVPAMEYPNDSNRDDFYNNSTALLSNASNIRIQDINLSYLIDKRDWPAMPFKTAQLYLYLNNVGIIWRANKYGIDPDFQSGLQRPSSASIGLKFGL